MKIISKFHDYYDVAVWYDSDPNCIFVRKEETFVDKQPVDIKFPIRVNEIVYYCGRFSKINDRKVQIEKQMLLFFCGRIYPILSIQAKWDEFEDSVNDRGQIVGKKVEKSSVFYCYSVEETRTVFRKYGTKDDEKFLKIELGNYLTGETVNRRLTKRQVMEIFFEESSKSFSEGAILDMHFTLQSPYFVYARNTRDHKNDEILTVNPALGKMEFYRVLSAPQALQEIEMFVSGVFGGQVPPIVEVSDKIRLEKHGFDSKTSFRKDKLK